TLDFASTFVGVEVDENLARRRTVFRTDDALVFHDVHDAGGAVVTDAQAALDHRSRSALRGTQDVERLLEQFAVIAEVVAATAARIVIAVAGRAIDLLLDRLRVLRRAVLLEEFDE